MEEKHIGLDMKTPINESLTAFYQRSFAYQTVKFRLPAILTQTVEVLLKKKEYLLRVFGEETEEEFKSIVAEINKLKLEILTNKPMRKLVGESPDIAQYNRALDLQSLKVSYPTFFNANWLFVECYMYRRIIECIEQTKTFKSLDPFQFQKEDSFFRALQVMAPTGTFLEGAGDDLKNTFIKLLKINLWGNKCDLSLTLGRIKYDNEALTDIENLDQYILCDDSSHVWDSLIEHTDANVVDIVMDNCGFELFTDMCLADFIIRNKYAEHVRFYVKAIPWYISDTTAKDFHWTLHQLKMCKNAVLKKLGERWNNYLRIKAWTIEEDSFWTLPVTYKDMAQWDIRLYRKLAAAKLIIFKGDVNYRKLFGEKNWPPTKCLTEALQDFHPSKICALRTVKAHIICGLPEGLAEDLDEKENDWLITGKYGLIQFCDTVVKK
ncbi:Damage-control phosphatase ARMT1-like domain [Popillia japonica]|uniref:Sugar phosphate phosphatase n=1 Tax=Popillia japonica TaxID=7064 RepID=A0AAW1JCC1_POPJA